MKRKVKRERESGEGGGRRGGGRRDKKGEGEKGRERMGGRKGREEREEQGVMCNANLGQIMCSCGCLLRDKLDKAGLYLFLMNMSLLAAHDADEQLKKHQTSRHHQGTQQLEWNQDKTKWNQDSTVQPPRRALG